MNEVRRRERTKTKRKKEGKGERGKGWNSCLRGKEEGRGGKRRK